MVLIFPVPGLCVWNLRWNRRSMTTSFDKIASRTDLAHRHRGLFQTFTFESVRTYVW
jgi:hypothetical protein